MFAINNGQGLWLQLWGVNICFRGDRDVGHPSNVPGFTTAEKAKKFIKRFRLDHCFVVRNHPEDPVRVEIVDPFDREDPAPSGGQGEHDEIMREMGHLPEGDGGEHAEIMDIIQNGG